MIIRLHIRLGLPGRIGLEGGAGLGFPGWIGLGFPGRIGLGLPGRLGPGGAGGGGRLSGIVLLSGLVMLVLDQQP